MGQKISSLSDGLGYILGDAGTGIQEPVGVLQSVAARYTAGNADARNEDSGEVSTGDGDRECSASTSGANLLGWNSARESSAGTSSGANWIGCGNYREYSAATSGANWPGWNGLLSESSLNRLPEFLGFESHGGGLTMELPPSTMISRFGILPEDSANLLPECLGFESSSEMMSGDYLTVELASSSSPVRSTEGSGSRMTMARTRREKVKTNDILPLLYSLNKDGRPKFNLMPLRIDGTLKIIEVLNDRPTIVLISRQDGRLRMKLMTFDQEEEEKEEKDEASSSKYKNVVEEEEEREEDKEDEKKTEMGGDGSRRLRQRGEITSGEDEKDDEEEEREEDKEVERKTETDDDGSRRLLPRSEIILGKDKNDDEEEEERERRG